MKYLTLLILVLQFLFGYGDSFSCPYGTQAACLDYSDKVCSSTAKCVDRSAVCFDSYTCNYKGFICKSKFDNLASTCQDLQDEYNSLVNKYNDLKEDAENLLSKYDDLESNYRSKKNCVAYATNLEEAKLCF